MSFPLLMNLIDEACKSGSITIDTKNYLFKKAVEFDISTEMVEKMLLAKKINIIEAEQTQNSTESVLSSINASLRKTFSDYLTQGNYDTIIDYFEDKLSGTLDYVLTDAYLKALLSKEEYQKAFTQSEKLKENIKSDLKKIYPTLGQIYLNAKKYNKAFDIYYSLLEDKEPDSQENLDLLVNNVLNDGEFDLLGKCRKNKNYLNLAKGKLPEFYECKKYLFYIKLFEADFQDDDSFVKNYIWSLYRNDGTEKNAYEKGKYYISKIANPESLSYVMGLTCSYLEKWIEAYDFFKNCLSRDIDVQEDIDKIIDKLITKNEWLILANFKDSINYETKVEQAFTSLKNAKKYNKAFDIYYSLLEDKEPDSQENLDLLVNNVLNDGEFDLLGKCRKNKNYLNLAKGKLPEFYECKKYLFYIKLFEADFQDDDSFVKNYIWSLYRNDGTEKNAYEKGKYYISKIANPESLSYVMGLTCSYLEKWIEAYDFFKNCLSRDIDVQEDIDKIIDKLITKNEWLILANFKDSINYETKVEQAFTSLNDADDYANIVSVFESLFFDTNDKYKIKRYISSLQEINFAKCVKKYKEFNSLFTTDDKYWLWIGGKIYEQNYEFESALNLFEKAESMEVGYCADDVKRVNYIIHPEIHFKDLYDDENFSDAIKIFELKLKKTTNIDLIVPYISSLYRNEGTEEKGLELGILYSKSNPDGEKLFRTIAFICKYLEKYSQAKEYFTKAKSAGFNVDEELQEINMIIAKAEEAERKRKEEEERKRKEDLERKRLEVQRKKEEAEERIQQEEEEEKRLEKQRKKEEKERKQQEIEEEENKLKDEQQKQDEVNSKVGSHEFKSSITRGGDAIFPEHIYVDDNEVTWEKKTGVFSKDSKTIPMKNITQIDIETSLIGAKIKIRSKGFGFIQGENFTKSDVKEIKSLIEKAQGNL